MEIEINEVLEQFNLDQKEAALYLASLELGLTSASNIAKKAGIQRTYFYDLSEKLIKLGLMKQVRKGRKRLFSATEPEKLVEMQEQRLQQLKSVLPELKSLYNTSGQKPRVFYYEGRDGIDEINADTLRYKGEILGFTTPRFVNKDQQRISRQYIQERIRVGNRVRVIGELAPEILELQQRDKRELRQTRILPRELYSSEVEIGIYGNKVFVIDYKEEFGFIIEGSDIAKVLKMIFEIVWGSGRVIER